MSGYLPGVSRGRTGLVGMRTGGGSMPGSSHRWAGPPVFGQGAVASRRTKILEVHPAFRAALCSEGLGTLTQGDLSQMLVEDGNLFFQLLA